MPRRNFTSADRAAIEARLAAAVPPMGRDLTRDLLTGSQRLYADLHETEPYDGLTVNRDVAYGADARQCVDIFEAVDGGIDRPILFYVHGGGFVRGEKKSAGLPFFHNIGVWAARRGFLGVNTTYRLATTHPAPAAEDDVAAAIAWTRANAKRYGGDPNRIILMGHSAGAVIVAGWIAAMGAETNGVVGAILGSGNYDFARLVNANNVRNYYGANYAAHSPLPGLRKSTLPIMVSVGEVETHDFQEQALVLVNALFERDGRFPRFVRQSGQNHYTCCFRIGFGEGDPIEREIEEFIRVDCASRSV
jgi:acetyl esterase/lipase